MNFALLGLGAYCLGGDAFNVRVEGGHYFLGTAGKLVEVSRAIWMYSYIHMVSNVVTFGLAVVAVTVLGFRGLLSFGGPGR